MSPLALRSLKKALRGEDPFRVYREEVLHSPDAIRALKASLEKRR